MAKQCWTEDVNTAAIYLLGLAPEVPKALDEGRATPETLVINRVLHLFSVHHSYCHFPLGRSREQSKTK